MPAPTDLRTLTNKAGVTEDLAKTSVFFASDWTGVKNWFSYVLGLFANKEDVSNKKTDLTDNSDTYYPTQKAVKTAVDAKQNSGSYEVTSNKKTDLTDNSDTYYPTQKAVKTAVDSKPTRVSGYSTTPASSASIILDPAVVGYGVFLISIDGSNGTASSNHGLWIAFSMAANPVSLTQLIAPAGTVDMDVSANKYRVKNTWSGGSVDIYWSYTRLDFHPNL